ncbi:MAG: 30S ribosome-binding factor RbfA [Acidobacteriota bacterium]
MGTRRERVSDLIRDEISRLLLRELRDPRIGFATVTAAEVSPDLRSARVFVSVLGDARARADSLRALNHASGFLRRALFKNLRLRYPPSIVFVLDDSLDRGERIEGILRAIRDSDGPAGGEGGPE